MAQFGRVKVEGRERRAQREEVGSRICTGVLPLTIAESKKGDLALPCLALPRPRRNLAASAEPVEQKIDDVVVVDGWFSS
jgi:hypothetical protein